MKSSLLTCAGEYWCSPGCVSSSSSSGDGRETNREPPKWVSTALKSDSCAAPMLLMFRLSEAGINQEDSCQGNTFQHTPSDIT